MAAGNLRRDACNVLLAALGRVDKIAGRSAAEAGLASGLAHLVGWQATGAGSTTPSAAGLLDQANLDMHNSALQVRELSTYRSRTQQTNHQPTNQVRMLLGFSHGFCHGFYEQAHRPCQP